jgi:hypothetical protein
MKKFYTLLVILTLFSNYMYSIIAASNPNIAPPKECQAHMFD